MANYLQMPKKQQVLALLELGWTYRRIEAETGVRRETVSRYDRARQANAAKTFPGPDSSGPTPASPRRALHSFFLRPLSFSTPWQIRPKRSPARRRRRFAAAAYRTAITEKLDAGRVCSASGKTWSRVQLRCQLRVGEAVRAHAHAAAPRRRRVSLRPRGRLW